jgi:trans-4-hydroxy-L-proline dehydratase
MKISERLKKLREQSINAVETLTAERGQLITEFYRLSESMNLSAPVRRAKAFEYILKNKVICINDGELIVGERGPAPKQTPSYPEICLHSVRDLEILNSREKVFFRVSEDVRRVYEEEIIPYWKGRSNRDKLMNSMTTEWLNAYDAGVFTEFQEQRAPGHTVLGYKMFSTGFLDLKQEIRSIVSSIDKALPDAENKLEELRAMEIACDAIIMFAERHADALRDLAINETDLSRKLELMEMEAVCRRVPAHAPRTVHEMLQHYWFIHLGVITELNPWDSFNPGRLDQHLYRVWKNEKDILSDDKAL